MKLGVCYYPEHWPQERWTKDASLMREAGISIVRLADFAWAALESVEAEFTWGWLDKSIAALGAEDLQVILCTPTASPPPWMCKAYPDILPVDVQGRRRQSGSRRHYCPTNPIYHQHVSRIVSALASRYGSNPTVVGWQIDNELGCHDTARCYCTSCAKNFREWLKRRYGMINALNEAWGTVFWSQTYSDWNEIEPPILTVAEPNPAHVLDYYRFSSDAYVDFDQIQISILRKLINKRQILTTNFMSEYTDLNYYDLASPLDLVTMSSYPTGQAESRMSIYMSTDDIPKFAFDVGDPYITSLGYARMRGYKTQQPFWVMEQQCGNINWSTYNTGIRPGTVRLWTWHALTSGAESVFYFRWRACLYAQEQLHSGLLHHDASPAEGYNDILLMKEERSLMSEISASPHIARIALLLDYDSLWALRLQPHHQGFDYIRSLFVYYLALQRLGLPADIISTDADLSLYKMVIVPTGYLATEQYVNSLIAFAESGGIVLLGVRSGFKTSSNQVNDQPLPGLFRDLVGINVSDWHSLPPGVSYDLNSKISGLDKAATLWAEALNPIMYDPLMGETSLKVLAYYTTGPFVSRAALTEYKIGQGRALYLGWYPSDHQAKALMSYLASRAGIHSIATLPEGLIASQRGDFTILLNFTDEVLAANVRGREISVDPRDVEIINIHD